MSGVQGVDLLLVSRKVPHDKVGEIVDLVGNLTVGELVALTKTLQDKYNVSPLQPLTGVEVLPEVVEEVEEQTEFDVVLKAVGEKKIQVVKVVREITSLGLKEAKDLVDRALLEGSVILTAVSKEKAEAAKQRMEAEGATVELV